LRRRGGLYGLLCCFTQLLGASGIAAMPLQLSRISGTAHTTPVGEKVFLKIKYVQAHYRSALPDEQHYLF